MNLPTFGPVLIKGAGDLASGVALRLWRAGFPVVMTEIAQPLTVRRMVAFAQAVFDEVVTVEGVTARRCQAAALHDVLAVGELPLVIDPETHLRRTLLPPVLVDGIMAKVNTGTRLDDAPLVVGIGPGFYAGRDCHAVIETDRGHDLGRVIRHGSAAPDTGLPGALPGLPRTASRILRAPQSGYVTPCCAIGDTLEEGALIASVAPVGGDPMPVVAPFRGVLRGLVHPSVPVRAGLKIGDLDPRARREYCFTVSDKSLAIGGGVLEVVCAHFFGRG